MSSISKSARDCRWLLAVAILCSQVLLCASLRADISRSFKLPILLVQPDNTGDCQTVEFTLTRKAGSHAPLSVAIAEDTPGGVGDSLRSSVWMAAMVAALDRLDDLSGVTIYLQLPGTVDGPSAGGSICLAILSALDGRDCPADCAMTGTIMPDGTIGSVGGIAAKMRGAAKAGAKRVLIPAYLRFEKDPKTGEQVDLKRLAGSLRLEYLPVENIAQAYCAVHRIALQHPVPPDRSVLDLPEVVEEVLKKKYDEELAAGTKLWESLSEQERKGIQDDPYCRPIFIDSRAKAEKAYRSGKLLFASEDVAAWHLFLRARGQNVAVFRSLTQPDFKKNVEQLDGELHKIVNAIPDPSTLIPADPQNSRETGAQLWSELCETYGILGIWTNLQIPLNEIIASIDKPENKEESRQRELVGTGMGLKAIQLLVVHAALEASRATAENIKKVECKIPSVKVSGDIALIERLFFSAYLAAHNCFEKDTVVNVASGWKVTSEQALNTMIEHDMSLSAYQLASSAMLELRDNLVKCQSLKNSVYHHVVAAHLYAGNLASVSALVMKWGELDVEVDVQGQLRYERTDLLNHLLSAARETALANIAECRKRSIPCIQPISYFENAELNRDDPAEDKVGVLKSYWNASLQAKVLLMLFGKAPATQETSKQ